LNWVRGECPHSRENPKQLNARGKGQHAANFLWQRQDKIDKIDKIDKRFYLSYRKIRDR
jgi:hypothetical protein